MCLFDGFACWHEPDLHRCPQPGRYRGKPDMAPKAHFGSEADLPLFASDARFQVLSRPNPLAVMILRCAERNGGADSSRRGKLAAGLPRFLRRRKARFRKPRAGLWNSGPRVLAYLVGTRKLRVSHELLAKREDEVKRLLLLKGQD